MRLTALPVVLAALGLVACRQDSANSPGAFTATVQPTAASKVSQPQGQELFLRHCSACHGKQAEGAPNWHKALPDGSWPPPPLNGTAHTWHHPKTVLMDVIRNGTADTGGKMPAWKDKLADREIGIIIAWLQTLWPEEIYKAWQEMDQRSQQQSP